MMGHLLSSFFIPVTVYFAGYLSIPNPVNLPFEKLILGAQNIQTQG